MLELLARLGAIALALALGYNVLRLPPGRPRTITIVLCVLVVAVSILLR